MRLLNIFWAESLHWGNLEAFKKDCSKGMLSWVPVRNGRVKYESNYAGVLYFEAVITTVLRLEASEGLQKEADIVKVVSSTTTWFSWLVLKGGGKG